MSSDKLHYQSLLTLGGCLLNLSETVSPYLLNSRPSPKMLQYIKHYSNMGCVCIHTAQSRSVSSVSGC